MNQRDLERMAARACGCGLTAPTREREPEPFCCKQIQELSARVDRLEAAHPKPPPFVLPNKDSPVTQHFTRLVDEAKKL